MIGQNQYEVEGLVSDSVNEPMIGIEWMESNDVVWMFNRGAIKIQGHTYKLTERQQQDIWVQRIVRIRSTTEQLPNPNRNTELVRYTGTSQAISSRTRGSRETSVHTHERSRHDHRSRRGEREGRTMVSSSSLWGLLNSTLRLVMSNQSLMMANQSLLDDYRELRRQNTQLFAALTARGYPEVTARGSAHTTDRLALEWPSTSNPVGCTEIATEQPSVLWTTDELKDAQLRDEALGPLCAAKSGEPPPLESIYKFASSRPERERMLWLQWESLKLVEGILQREHAWGADGEHLEQVLVLPGKYRTAVFQRAHLTRATVTYRGRRRCNSYSNRSIGQG